MVSIREMQFSSILKVNFWFKHYFIYISVEMFKGEQFCLLFNIIFTFQVNCGLYLVEKYTVETCL